jgi:LDH2 family malate/lactate/ureidoglycolate dehydrogenase
MPPAQEEKQMPGTQVDVQAAVRVTTESLRSYGIEAFTQAGLPEEGAAEVTEVQLEANLRGQPTHNMGGVPGYSKRMRGGMINTRPRFGILRESPVSVQLDGDNGPGQWVSVVAMRQAIALARRSGVGLVTAYHSNHFGAAGHYAWLAAKDGLIGFACTNFNALVAPPGGRTPVFGTNPLAYGIPAGRHPPVVLDIATTMTSMQKVRVAAEDRRPMPEGVILDQAGQPTTDPKELLAGGLMAPLGNPHAPHKGFGLAMLIDALSGVLSGAGFASGVATAAPGNFLWALDVEALMPRDEFLARMDAQIDEIKQGERLPGVNELVVPGERGARRHAELTARGVVPLSQASWQILSATCEALDARLPQLVED